MNKTSYSLIKKSLDRDSILYQKKVLSLAELEDAKINILAAQKNFSTANSTLANNEYQFESALSQLQQLKIQKKETENSLQLNLISSFHELKEAIKEWKIKYALIAPVDGVIEYADFWTDNQYIFTNQEIFSVVPETNKIHAQVMLPEHGAGKVHKGQKVIIKLNDFPYNEYGAISGIVTEISLVSGKRIDASNQSLSQYLVKVDLPNGLKTNYGSELKFKFGEKGTAEIITANRRLYERMFDNLKYQLKRE